MDFLTTLFQTIAYVPAIVNAIEGLFSHRTGAEKKDAAMSFLQAVLCITNTVANRQIIDPQKFKHGLGQLIDGTIECLNASAWAKTH